MHVAEITCIGVKTYAYYKDICIKGDVRQRTNESLIIEDYEYTLKIQHGGGGGGGLYK